MEFETSNGNERATTGGRTTRRALLVGAMAALAAGCTPVIYAERYRLEAGGPHRGADSYATIYGPIDDERFPLDALDLSEIDPEYLRQVVAFNGPERPGTVIVAPSERHLYLVLEGGRAVRYGVGVGREGFAWSGRATIRRKAEWPTWTPPHEMTLRDPEAAKWASGMPGGPDNPLGARALYLYQGDRDTLYRLHGNNDPSSIGKAVSSGCIRMLNHDIIDLYRRVPVGSPVVVTG
ncbi:L,D-transpeptidase [Siculibacillus lacustris]|uniref:L,D-transpeptidase n=1 Tax=Siculibacillus lacustris TaxID=1549641 RepID=A0A4Q9VUZ8_9HYPH|nr:L,D-transpeptidase [Siculibacillus lacustris]TBW40016.1 L,D-transpeptidase [Siculibacillus lacustris]